MATPINVTIQPFNQICNQKPKPCGTPLKPLGPNGENVTRYAIVLQDSDNEIIGLQDTIDKAVKWAVKKGYTIL